MQAIGSDELQLVLLQEQYDSYGLEVQKIIEWPSMLELIKQEEKEPEQPIIEEPKKNKKKEEKKKETKKAPKK